MGTVEQLDDKLKELRQAHCAHDKEEFILSRHSEELKVAFPEFLDDS